MSCAGRFAILGCKSSHCLWLVHRGLPCLVSFILFLQNGIAFPQDLRVVTTVSHRPPDSGRWQPVAHSLTLFHGDKVYDWVEEVGEVVIHEPSQNQFVVVNLNGSRMGAIVRHEEVLQFLKVARTETVKYMDNLQANPTGSSAEQLRTLAFQLEPRFDESYDPATGRLRLSSESVAYQVDTAPVERDGVVNQYLDWADWAARLNYILHPQTLTPESRMALNNALRRHGRIPTQVELTLSFDGGTKLRAEHAFDWKLRSFDRHSITNWENTRNSADLRWIDLREYQRILLTSAARRGR